MDRKAFLAIATAALFSCVGCNGKTAPKTVGEWDKAQVEKWFTGNERWKEIHLTEDEHWKYHGTGTNAEGKEWKITVTQFANGLDWSASDGKGSQMSSSFRSDGTSAKATLPPMFHVRE